jgi:hypothetical protein
MIISYTLVSLVNVPRLIAVHIKTMPLPMAP